MRADAYPFFDADFLAFAHRGGALYPPNLHRENSRHAFAEAVALGYRYLETDVHLTADGVLVAFHDDALDRVTDATGRIATLPYDVVSRARIGGQDPIPTLAELLAAFPEVRFNIDAKSDRAVDVLARTIADHEAYDRVCVSSFGVRRLLRLRRLVGHRTASAASARGIALNRFAPWLTAVLDSPAPALQMPADRRVFGRDLHVLTDRLIRTVHRHGKQVHIWTIDDQATMDRLIDSGVDGIFTDRPDTLKSVLQRRGRWDA
ncbi:MAG TPA: glycerophosphodiester phosphodiesterase family protein [Microlunatus sp.]|jgi:glycerophosphoryl diester phosphodiesterase|nr:glycerophosphodiester phosphodiesterase family protein [Microlunatus sp.]